MRMRCCCAALRRRAHVGSVALDISTILIKSTRAIDRHRGDTRRQHSLRNAITPAQQIARTRVGAIVAGDRRWCDLLRIQERVLVARRGGASEW